MALGPTQTTVQWAPGLFTGVKRPGRDVDHPPTSSAEVKERVELYLTPHLGLRSLTSILVYGKLAWKKAMDLLQDRLRDDDCAMMTAR